MFRNYLRVALRCLLRNRFSAVINIGGLAIGMAVAILIGLWIFDEVSYNRNFVHHDRIAAVLQNQNLSGGVQTWWGQAMQPAPALRKEYGNHFKYVITGTGGDHSAMSYGDKQIKPSGGGRIQYVRLYGLTGIFVLLLACINFMNLSTARSEKRAKEVGIRKAIGSLRWQLVRQFFVESILIAAFSFVLAIVVAQLLLPLFNNLADKDMSIPWGSPLFWMTGLLFTLLTGLLAGSYPALYLSSFRPVKVLKGNQGFRRFRTYPSRAKGTNESERGTMFGRSSERGTTLWAKFFRAGRLASAPRKSLVVVQFTVSVILIIGTITIFHQIQYVKDRPVGYTREGLLMVSIQSKNVSDHLAVISDELKQTGLIREVSASQSDATNTWVNNMGFQWQGKDPALQESFTTNGVSPDFGKTTGWQITQGRDFSADLATDSGSFIINETAVKYMGLRHPLGKIVKWGNDSIDRYTIVGVVKDMITQNPDQPVPPMIFFIARYSWMLHTVNIRLDPSAGMNRSLAAIQSIFKKYDPGNTIAYRFADEEYARKFEEDERVGRLAGGFTVLAILISCLGLVGLSSFIAEQRTREIGVRKVLGASVLSLWGLLSQEFVILVGLSLVIGSPIAFWIMHGWLQNYAYHATLTWWIFALAAGGAITLALLTVSWQAIRAAMANPVRSLRAE